MNVSEARLDEIFIPTAEVKIGAPLTAIMVDGNSFVAASGRHDGENLHVENLMHMELDRLVEVTRRLRHPIFMDVGFSHYPGRDLITERLRDTLARPEFDHPVVIVVSPDKLRVEEITGPNDEKSKKNRAKALLLGSLPFNPYEFPSVIQLQQTNMGDHGVTRVIAARLADTLPLVNAVREVDGRFAGLISGLSASAEIVNRLIGVDENQYVILSDVGKLRTLYTVKHPDGRIHYSPIPVGLARDDVHYFKAIAPSATQLIELGHSLGNLLFPPESTPSPLFSGYISSPQIDCTRFAIQISRYAARCLDGQNCNSEHPEKVVHYLAGRASRLPGLRPYMEARLNHNVRRIDRRPLSGIRVANKLHWGDLADSLSPVGALIEAVKPGLNSHGLLRGKLHAPPIRREVCTIGKIEENQLYVFERKIEMR